MLTSTITDESTLRRDSEVDTVTIEGIDDIGRLHSKCYGGNYAAWQDVDLIRKATEDLTSAIRFDTIVIYRQKRTEWNRI